MRKLSGIVSLLLVAATPAFANFFAIPEPETLSMVAVGAVAVILAARRKNKK
jgi:hypothetical protein